MHNKFEEDTWKKFWSYRAHKVLIGQLISAGDVEKRELQHLTWFRYNSKQFINLLNATMTT